MGHSATADRMVWPPFCHVTGSDHTHVGLSFSVLITTSCQVWSRWTYPLPYHSVFAADTLLYAVNLTSDPVTLTFNLWLWTFLVYRLWRDETLCQIWTQFIYLLWSDSDFIIWTNDLQHVLLVVLGSGIIFTKFDIRQLIREYSVFMMIRYVTLWPWPLTR